MPLHAAQISNQLESQRAVSGNLTAACQGILEMQLASSDSPRYAQLQNELKKAQDLAHAWVDDISVAWQRRVLPYFVHCTNQFVQRRDSVMRLFDQAGLDPVWKPALHQALAELQFGIQVAVTEVKLYESDLRTWGQRLQSTHDQMADTIGSIQAQEDALQADIEKANAIIADLQRQIIRDQQAIADAKNRVIIAGPLVIFPAISIGPSGVKFVFPLAEATEQLSVHEAAFQQHQSQINKIVTAIDQDQAQMISLQGLLLPTGTALSDLETAENLLSDIRVSWCAFFDELTGMFRDIRKADTSQVLEVQKGMFEAACHELDMINTNIAAKRQ